MKIDGHLSTEDMLAQLQAHVMRRLMDEQTTQSFSGALRAKPDKIVVSAKDAQAAVERLERYRIAHGK